MCLKANPELTTYPYHKTPDGHLFPVIPLKLSFQGRVADTSALIDSGATISIFRPEVAEQLGIEIETGNKVFLGGVGGRIKGFIHTLKMEISGKEFACPIVFSYEYTVSFNLLGRDSFFEQFCITFDEKNRKVKLE